MQAACYLKKIGMSQIIDEEGKVIPVTLCQYLPQEVVEYKTIEKHGYEALVIAYDDVSEKKVNKPRSDYFKRLKKDPKKHLAEIRLDSDVISKYKDSLSNNNNDNDSSDSEVESSAGSSDTDSPCSLGAFSENDIVQIQGKSKGKGFQGTVKVHNFARGPMTHGSKNHRLPGSIGAGTDPARVFKGTKMAKRLGFDIVTIKNLSLQKLDSEERLLYIKGAIPGKRNDYVLMYK